MASKAVTLPVPDVDLAQAQEAVSKALNKFARIETATMVAGIFVEAVIEKAAYRSLRSVFGHSGQGLTDSERFARQFFRFGLGLLGAYLSVSGKKPEERAFGTGLMAEAAVSLLKGFGLAIV